MFLQERVFDPFVIYNENLGYAAVRAAVNEAHHGKQIDQLKGSTKVQCVHMYIVILRIGVLFYDVVLLKKIHTGSEYH